MEHGLMQTYIVGYRKTGRYREASKDSERQLGLKTGP